MHLMRLIYAFKPDTFSKIFLYLCWEYTYVGIEQGNIKSEIIIAFQLFSHWEHAENVMQQILKSIRYFVRYDICHKIE